MNNEQAEKQSFCIIRELTFDKNNKELVSRMKKSRYLNRDNFDDIQLENLKFYVKKKIPNSVLKFQVSLVFDFNSFFAYLFHSLEEIH